FSAWEWDRAGLPRKVQLSRRSASGNEKSHGRQTVLRAKPDGPAFERELRCRKALPINPPKAGPSYSSEENGLHGDDSPQQKVGGDEDEENYGDDTIHGKEGGVELAQIIF